MKVNELIKLLQDTVEQDSSNGEREVWADGCDCTNPVTSFALHDWESLTLKRATNALVLEVNAHGGLS